MVDLYNRQEKLNLNTDVSIAVVGCGGIGYWVCKFAAMAGIEKIYCFDFDTIELHNLNRLDLSEKFIGMNKADAVKMVVEELRSECTIIAMPYKFGDMHKPNTDWLVDCTDDDTVQLENQKIAEAQNMRYVKAGYDGEGMGIHDRVAEWGVDEFDGYRVVPSWVVPATIVAAMTIAKIQKYEDHEMVTSIQGIFKAPRIE
jgi:hypothetical protein